MATYSSSISAQASPASPDEIFAMATFFGISPDREYQLMYLAKQAVEASLPSVCIYIAIWGGLCFVELHKKRILFLSRGGMKNSILKILPYLLI